MDRRPTAVANPASPPGSGRAEGIPANGSNQAIGNRAELDVQEDTYGNVEASHAAVDSNGMAGDAREDCSSQFSRCWQPTEFDAGTRSDSTRLCFPGLELGLETRPGLGWSYTQYLWFVGEPSGGSRVV